MLALLACKQDINYYCQNLVSLLEIDFLELLLFNVIEEIARNNSDIVNLDIFTISRFEI